MSSQQPVQSEAFRDGYTLGQLHCAKGQWRINEMKCDESRAGYDAGWSATFFAKHPKKKTEGTIS